MSKKVSGSKVVIIGAGQVGATIAYAMSIQQACRDLVLVDIMADKAEGEAMDIAHGLPFLGEMAVRSAGYEECADADVIVFAAGAARKPGETRMDLAAKNCRIAKSATTEMMKYYNGAVILVVANPVDVITYKICQWTGLPTNKVVGSGTVLDSIRFRYLLSEKFNIDVKNVHGYIIGEHGDTQFPAWSATNIAGFSIDDYCTASGISFSAEERDEIALKTKKAGAEVIKRKGATFYGIGISVSSLVMSLLKDSDTIRTVGIVLDGEYGLKDTVVNIPCIISSDGVTKVLELKLTDDEAAKLQASGEAVKSVIEHVKDI
ncbi:L-lactate dehydrogenase [Oscillospiraceae bacterium HV4-5-C5C]|nr:L-lactate dehydrogenase [Oscillospiraceae bacterium HV4-5-C5C]